MKIYHVNSFIGKGFNGNPAGLVIMNQNLDYIEMLAIAKEVGYSETAFLLQEENNRNYLRWFTPQTEVGLCGHATLATAHVFFQENKSDKVEFETKYGVIECSRINDSISMNFASDRIITCCKDFDLSPLKIHKADIVDVFWAEKNCYLNVVVNPEYNIRKIEPLADKLLELSQYFPSISGLMISQQAEDSDGQKCVNSRFFDPWEGILEDPVTGSAHVAMANYWFEKLTCNRFIGKQLSPRGGIMQVVKAIDKVELIGKADIKKIVLNLKN